MSINQNDIIYFILTDRFYGKPNTVIEKEKNYDKSNPNSYHGGNFEGIIEKIPYLKNLGITCLWITPVYLQIDFEDKQAYHGYWTLDFNKVNPTLYIDNKKYEAGSKLYLKDLVDELHRNNIKIVLDMVVNNTGYNHPALKNPELNSTEIQHSWFHEGNENDDENKVVDKNRNLPDLNLDNPDVCDFHIRTILSWIRETGIDAIRMDTVNHVERKFWEYFKNQIKGLYPDVCLLGEVWTFDIDTLAEYQKLWAFDLLFDFPIYEAMKKVFIDDFPLKAFVSPFNAGYGVLERDEAYTNHNKLVTLLDNHDLPERFLSTILQKHDNLEIATWIMKLSLSFMFTIRGIPLIYYGTEIGMQGFQDPDNRRDFCWEKIDEQNSVKKEFVYEREIFEHTRKLIDIRKKSHALTVGNFVNIYVDNYVMVYVRYIEDEVVIVTLHNGWIQMPMKLEISINETIELPSRIKDLIKNRKLTCQVSNSTIDIQDGIFSIKMKPKSANIYM